MLQESRDGVALTDREAEGLRGRLRVGRSGVGGHRRGSLCRGILVRVAAACRHPVLSVAGALRSPPKCLDELFRLDAGLAQNASQRADLDFAVHRQYAARRLALHDDVTAALTNFLESETLKCPLHLRTGYSRKLRHAPALAP